MWQQRISSQPSQAFLPQASVLLPTPLGSSRQLFVTDSFHMIDIQRSELKTSIEKHGRRVRASVFTSGLNSQSCKVHVELACPYPGVLWFCKTLIRERQTDSLHAVHWVPYNIRRLEGRNPRHLPTPATQGSVASCSLQKLRPGQG